jgi:hypothetical protein
MEHIGIPGGTTAALEQLLRDDSDAWRLPQDRTMRGRDKEFEDALRMLPAAEAGRGGILLVLPTPRVADTRGPVGGRRRERPVVGRRACRPAGRRPGAAHGGKPAAHGGSQMLVVLTTWNALKRHALGATGPGPGGLEINPAGIRPATEAARGGRPALGHRARPADPARSSRSALCWAGRSALDNVAALLGETPERLLPDVEAALGADLLVATACP